MAEKVENLEAEGRSTYLLLKSVQSLIVCILTQKCAQTELLQTQTRGRWRFRNLEEHLWKQAFLFQFSLGILQIFITHSNGCMDALRLMHLKIRCHVKSSLEMNFLCLGNLFRWSDGDPFGSRLVLLYVSASLLSRLGSGVKANRGQQLVYNLDVIIYCCQWRAEEERIWGRAERLCTGVGGNLIV